MAVDDLVIMAEKRQRNLGNKANKSLSSIKDSIENDLEVVKAGDMHSYANFELETNDTLFSDLAPNTPVTKKGKIEPTTL